MKDKKKLALANLIAGYTMVIAFIALIFVNRPTPHETTKTPTSQDELSTKTSSDDVKIAIYGSNRIAISQGSVFTDPGFKAVNSEGTDVSDQVVVTGLDKVDTTMSGFTYEIEYTYINNKAHETKLSRFVTINDTNFIVNNDVVYQDRLQGVVLNNTDPIVAVVNNDPIYIDRDHDIVVDDTHRYGAVENHGNGGNGGNRRDHTVGRSRVTEHDIDSGFLDRRIAQRDLFTDETNDDVIANKKKKFGLDKDGVNLGNLTVANDRDNDAELGDVGDLNFDDNPNGNFGINKGDLYAYAFPSQGVGAGIGSGAVGAGASASAGLGAGIGQAVSAGETVPALGGIGTYSSVPVVEPGTGTDTDNDGLEVEAELALGTDPTKADSDGDGYTDGQEITSYTNPSDPASNPGVPGSSASPSLGGVAGLINGAGSGAAAGLITGMVKPQLGVPGVAPGVGVGNGGYGKRNYDLPQDGALHIMMHVDGSGSILNTRKQLEIMKNTLLKKELLPYYNNDENLYNKRVTIVDGNGERTLQFFTEAAKKDNVLAIVFQDEAQPAYHLPNFNKKPEDGYVDDLDELKHKLSGYGGLYRGIMFQVDRGKTFAKSFKEFVGNAFQGTGYLKTDNLKKYYYQENQRHIQNKNGIVFSDEYHAKDEGDPSYYMNLILEASKKVGIDLKATGAGLTDGKYNKKTQ